VIDMLLEGDYKSIRIYNPEISPSLLSSLPPKPVFLNVYGAQESISRNAFRLPMFPGGPVR
jgi:hypothetical protein